MKYKKWSLKKKLEILTGAEEIGVVKTYRKYGVSTGTFYVWKKKINGWSRFISVTINFLLKPFS